MIISYFTFQGEVSSEGAIEACDVIVHVYVTSFLTGDPLATVTFNNEKVRLYYI